ncbi:hypothetical protein [Kitasatospora sp. McL0602]|uniref:hypothetical protein n=1 Tax=Kitasatospora sp. McL0602 TaxID=3439530 RepID=UPI003F88774E
MATQLTGAVRRGRQTGHRHPAVAFAIALPCAALLVMLFGWEQLAAQIRAVADLIGR